MILKLEKSTSKIVSIRKYHVSFCFALNADMSVSRHVISTNFDFKGAFEVSVYCNGSLGGKEHVENRVDSFVLGILVVFYPWLLGTRPRRKEAQILDS